MINDCLLYLSLSGESIVFFVVCMLLDIISLSYVSCCTCGSYYSCWFFSLLLMMLSVSLKILIVINLFCYPNYSMFCYLRSGPLKKVC